VRSTLRIAGSRWRRRRLPIDPQTGASGGTLRLLTLNVAHGRKLATHQALLSPATVRKNLEEIASVLRESRADVVALQEADGPSAWERQLRPRRHPCRAVRARELLPRRSQRVQSSAAAPRSPRARR
jgi:hypothetical protein